MGCTGWAHGWRVWWWQRWHASGEVAARASVLHALTTRVAAVVAAGLLLGPWGLQGGQGAQGACDWVACKEGTQALALGSGESPHQPLAKVLQHAASPAGLCPAVRHHLQLAMQTDTLWLADALISAPKQGLLQNSRERLRQHHHWGSSARAAQASTGQRAPWQTTPVRDRPQQATNCRQVQRRCPWRASCCASACPAPCAG